MTLKCHTTIKYNTELHKPGTTTGTTTTPTTSAQHGPARHITTSARPLDTTGDNAGDIGVDFDRDFSSTKRLSKHGATSTTKDIYDINESQ